MNNSNEDIIFKNLLDYCKYKKLNILNYYIFNINIINIFKIRKLS